MILTFKQKDVPFLLGGTGELVVDTGTLPLDQPLPETATSLLNVGFKAGSDRKLSLGRDNSVRLGISTSASSRLTAAFAPGRGDGARLLEACGLGGFFEDESNAGKVVIGLDLGASGAAAAGSFSYSALKAGAEVDAGGDGGYTYLRALDKTLPLRDLLPAFFERMRLPEQDAGTPAAGEAVALRYGGYLSLSADLSAGYRLAGTQSVSLGEMALSEEYGLSILGKAGLSAGVAGRFSIVVTGTKEKDWARMLVRRSGAGDFKVAADVKVGFRNRLQGLPGGADEFLGAALGVNGKSFVNLLQKAREFSDYGSFKDAVDGLARSYIAAYIGKAFDKLESAPEFNRFLRRVDEVVSSYEKLGDRAVTLFDRYFHAQRELKEILSRILSLTTLEPLAGELDPRLWNILSQLTDGDPQGFLLGQVSIGDRKLDSLAELKERAHPVLELLHSEDPAHDEIRSVIALARSQFGIGTFFRELARIGTPEELQALANDKAGQFVTRLVGRGLDSNASVRKAFDEVRAVLEGLDRFQDSLFRKFRDAAGASYKAALHAEYSRSSESDALVDVRLNLADARGAGLLKLAGRGDFEKILSVEDTTLVRLQEGMLTHHTRRQSAFRVNIVGWHLNYRYGGFDRVITESEQRLVPSESGLTIFTKAEMEIERMRKRNGEEMHVNFLLRALGESANAVRSDERNLGYLIDTLTGLTARYRLSFTDQETTEGELRDYLAFAKDLGLDRKGATLAELAPTLVRGPDGSYGPVAASYDVRFGTAAITSLLSVKELSRKAEDAVRSAMRRMVLAGYLKDDGLHDIAFAYATPAIYERFTQLGSAAFVPPSAREEIIAIDIPGIAAPAKVLLERSEYQVLVTLYNIEDSLVEAIGDLYRVLGAGTAIKPRDFEKKLGKFGEALQQFDQFDQGSAMGGVGATTVFAMFDMLVRVASGGQSATAATLTLRSKAGGEDVEKVFRSG